MMIRGAGWVLADLQDEEWREAWVKWFRGFGIDPADVCVPGWVEADDDARTITVLMYPKDDDGRRIVEWDRLAGGGACGFRRAARVVQLEVPPLPFPGDEVPIRVVRLADPEHPTARELAAGPIVGHVPRDRGDW